MRAGAALHRSTGLPLLASGGIVDRAGPPIGVLMASGLAEDFATPVRWTDQSSADTWENAEQSAALLLPDGVRVIDPAEGEMACGEFGPGRLPEPQEIIDTIGDLLK